MGLSVINGELQAAESDKKHDEEEIPIELLGHQANTARLCIKQRQLKNRDLIPCVLQTDLYLCGTNVQNL